MHRPDAGSIIFKGAPAAFASPTEARGLGIETVYQDLALVEDLTVWQNMYLNRELKRGTLAGIVRDARLGRDDLQRLL